MPKGKLAGKSLKRKKRIWPRICEEVLMHPIFPQDNEGNIKIKPLGYVRSPVKKPQTGGLTEIEADIIVTEECANCLDGIEDFSHIVVVFWLNQITSHRETCHPQGREDVPLLGMLATR
jgi:tRNA (Thr-GGU) A37 N-methylase